MANLSQVATADGEQPKAEIPGYPSLKLRSAQTAIRYIYERLQLLMLTKMEAIQDIQRRMENNLRSIPGYGFVKTIVDANGNINTSTKKVA